MNIFDGHTDIFHHVDTRKRQGNERDIFRKYHLPNFQKGNVTGGIFAIFIDHNDDVSKMQSDAVAQIKHAAIELSDAKDIVKVILTASDLDYAMENNMIGAVIGLEGLSWMDSDPELLYPLYQFGARSAMLSWNKDNKFGGGAKNGTKKGITEIGRRAIRIMNELNMIIDVSHSNEETFWGVMEEAKGPVIASHNNALKVAKSLKNLTDEQLMCIKEKNGIVGYNALHFHTAEDTKLHTIQGAANQIDYMVNLIGADHVGFGFDFLDFMTPFNGKNPNDLHLEGLRNCGEAGNLVDELRRRGYSEEDLEKICHKNYYRVIQEVLLPK